MHQHARAMTISLDEEIYHFDIQTIIQECTTVVLATFLFVLFCAIDFNFADDIAQKSASPGTPAKGGALWSGMWKRQRSCHIISSRIDQSNRYMHQC